MPAPALRTRLGHFELENLVLEPVWNDTNHWVYNVETEDLNVTIRNFGRDRVPGAQWATGTLPSGETNTDLGGSSLNSTAFLNMYAIMTFDGREAFNIDGTAASAGTGRGAGTIDVTTGRNVWRSPVANANPSAWPTVDFRTNLGVTRQSERGATIVSTAIAWDVVGTTVPKIYSGRINEQIMDVRLETNSQTEWDVRRETVFELVDKDGNVLIDDVKITRVQVRDVRGIVPVRGSEFPSTATGTMMYWNRDNSVISNSADSFRLTQTYSGAPYNYANAYFTREGNSFVLRELFPQTTASHPAVTLRFFVSANPNFTGDVYIKVSGGSITLPVGAEVVGPVARVIPMLNVYTQETDVQIGYQNFSVANITIVENSVEADAPVLSRGDIITLQVGQFDRFIAGFRNVMQFVPITRNNVAPLTSQETPFRVTHATTTNLGVHRITIDRSGSSAANAGRIDLVDLALDIDRTIPEGTFDLLINVVSELNPWIPNMLGNAEHMWLYDRFAVDGMTRILDYNERFGEFGSGTNVELDYFVRMVTRGANPQSIQEIRLRNHSNEAIVNGKEEWIEYPAEIRAGRMYVPLRLVVDMLGQRVVWDGVNETVSIFTLDGKTIQFAVGVPEYFVNGIVINMDNVAPFIHEVYERVYVPWAALGDALGAEVRWCPIEQEVIFNTRGMNTSGTGGFDN
jgi:hypothetical protein